MSDYSFDLEAGKTLKLLTAGKYCDRDIVVKAIGGGSVSDVPEGYTRLEYIKATGKQSVNTGVKANQDTRVIMTVRPTVNTNEMNDWMFEGRNSANVASFGVFCDYTLNIFYSDYGTSRLTIPYTSWGEKVTIDFNKNTITIGETTVTHPTQTFQSDYPLYLFCMNSANSQKGYGEGEIYPCLIYGNGALVRDYVPVIYKTTGEAGLYDKVNHVFYPSAGTQPFIAGPVLTA